MTTAKNKPSSTINIELISITKELPLKNNKFHFLLKVSPNENINKKRTKLNLSLVIDASPSMQGKPLEYAKNAAQNIIDKLSDGDRVAIVSYATNVELKSESTIISKTNKISLKNPIKNIEIFGGSTALYDGWLKGANEIAPYATNDVISRVLLLSDGQANHGLTNIETISNNVSKLFNSGKISTSTYGIGYGFNELLMTKMAQAGSGRAFYAQDAKVLSTYFDQELNGLDRLCGQNVKVDATLKIKNKNVDFQWLNSVNGDMSSLISGTESWLLGKIENLNLKNSDSKLKYKIAIQWTDMDGVAQKEEKEFEIPIINKTPKEPLKENSEVAERIKEMEVAILQEKINKDVQNGQWDKVEQYLSTIKSMIGNNAYIKSVYQNLNHMTSIKDSASMLKETQYGAYMMSTRQVRQNEDFTLMDQDDLGLRKGQQGTK